MAKIDLKDILIVAAAAAAQQAAAQSTTAMQPKDVPVVVEAVKNVIATSPDVKEAQKELNVKTNQEPWYQSVQQWVALASAMMAIVGGLGYVIPEDIQKQVLAVIPMIFGTIGFFALIYNRYFRFRSS